MKFLIWLVLMLILVPVAIAMYGVLRESIIRAWKEGATEPQSDTAQADQPASSPETDSPRKS